MRILIVTQYFWPEGFRINDVVKSLVERGIEVDVLTGKPNYPEGKIYSGYKFWGCSRESWCGTNIFRVPLLPRGKNSALYLALNYLSFIFFGLICGSFLLRRRKYDVVFVYGLSPILLAIPGIFLAWLKDKKLILWVQDLWPESLSATGYVKNSFVLKSIEYLVRWIYRHTDLLLVQSRAFESPIAALAPNKEIIYYPNSVDSSFTKTANMNNKNIEVDGLESGFSVVFAGNVGAAQAVECIVEAATILRDRPQLRFVIFGSGSKLEWIREQISERKLKNIFLAGRFPIDCMPFYLQKAGALLVSLSDEPIFALTVPNKMQAYLASGRPIIASLNGEGARLITESKAGIAVPAEDPMALADAVIQISEMSYEAREKLGENGRKFYRNHFDHDDLVEQLIGYLRMGISSKDGDKS